MYLFLYFEHFAHFGGVLVLPTGNCVSDYKELLATETLPRPPLTAAHEREEEKALT